MPVIGNLENNIVIGRSNNISQNRRYATAIKEMAESINENTGIDYFFNSHSALMNAEARRALENFFVEESADINEFAEDPDMFKDHQQMMKALFENDRDQMLQEYAAIGSYNPVMGLVFPLHKNLLMNNIFDKGAINKAVAKTPKFTLSMKIRKLIAKDGTEIDLFTDQDKIYDTIESTAPVMEFLVPAAGLTPGSLTDVKMRTGSEGNFTAVDAAAKSLSDVIYGPVPRVSAPYNALSIETAITGVVVNTKPNIGDEHVATDGTVTKVDSDAATTDVLVKIAPRKFEPGYGELDRQMMTKVMLNVKDAGGNVTVKEVYFSGFMKNGQVMINCSDPTTVKGIVLSSRRDTSSGILDTCSVRWDAITNIVEIPNAIPIRCPISPEEVKDVAALYNEDQLSNILGLFKTVLGTYKDDKIHKELDKSFISMPQANKFRDVFDFAPQFGYAHDPVEWRRKTFMDYFDNMVTKMIQVLNDPNVTVSVIGSPAIIRKITPTEYTYQSPSNIGPVDIEYKRTVVTSDKRVYNFIGSDKMRNNQNLIVLLNPRNTDRIIYCIYDYQLYMSNEIRDYSNPALPAVSAFERFKFVGYQPVQGRMQILNPSGYRTDYASGKSDEQFIGNNLMNDYDTFVPDKTQAFAGATDFSYGTENEAKAKSKSGDIRKVEPTNL